MELECEFRITNYTFNSQQNESGYNCRVKKIIYNPALTTIIINGNHQELMNNNNVKGISIDNIKDLRGIPYGLTKIFPNLIYLQIRNCGLKKLQKKDLVSLQHLQGLWLPENDIVALDNDLFEKCQGIKHLSFHKNKLKFIGCDIFKPLKNLTSANFMENTCINKNYSNGNQEELNELIEEIILRCQNTTNMDEIDHSKLENIAMKKEIAQLKNHIKKLEDKINAFETNKNANIISRIDTLDKIVSEMQIRLTIVEDSCASQY